MDSDKTESLKEALKHSPDNPSLLKLFAGACMEDLSFEEAKRAYDKILVISPDDIDAAHGAALSLFHLGETSEAAVRAESLLKKNPKSSISLALLAKIAISERNLQEARTYYEKAKLIDPMFRDETIERELLGVVSNSAEKSSSELVSKAPDDYEKPNVNFSHVGGMEEVKEEIRMKIIYPLKNPELFKSYGKKTGGGVLLYGPPGCGKTLISRATAGEINASFFSIGLHQILDMYVGNSEKNLHGFFEAARNNNPSVIFIDEIDALAADRKDMKYSASRPLINQFLAELDGNIGSNEGVLILGATNAPWHIDPAFRRPGRFDRIIFVPIPDAPAREEIIKIISKDKPIADLDFSLLAKKTQGFTGADIKAMFDVAIERLLSKAMKQNKVVIIKTEDLLDAAKGIVPSSKPWFETAKNYAIHANESGFYDPVLKFLQIKK